MTVLPKTYDQGIFLDYTKKKEIVAVLIVIVWAMQIGRGMKRMMRIDAPVHKIFEVHEYVVNAKLSSPGFTVGGTPARSAKDSRTIAARPSHSKNSAEQQQVKVVLLSSHSQSLLSW